jgi:hypothetical protein
MSIEETGFIRLPPDSTGKKSAAAGRLIIDFENEINNIEVGQVLTGATSSATGTVVGVSRIGFAAGMGQVFLEDTGLDGTFVAGENLVIGPTVYASITATAPLNTIYYQKGVLVDRDTPSRSLSINQRGAANVTFTEGQPSLNSFGALLVAESTQIRQYVFAYDALDGEFYSTSGVGGGYTYSPDDRSVVLDTNGVASGAFCKRQTHFYHPYQAGTATRIYNSVACGDTGKANVIRRWGLYDDENGYFWELDGTTLNAVIRSKTTGTVQETRISQADFNRDRLDGSTNFNLDVSKANLYWIDFQWLGVGIAAFGVYEEDGTRTTAHVFENPNTNMTSYTRQGTLPFSNEIINSNTTSSSSELRVVCCSVQSLGKVTNQQRTRAFSSNGRTISSANGSVPLVTIRPKTTINGQRNSAIGLIDHFEVFNEGNSPVKIRLENSTFPSGANFLDIDSEYVVEIDQSASGFLLPTNKPVSCAFAPSGVHTREAVLSKTDYFQNDIGTLLLGNNLQPGISVCAEVIGSGTATCHVSITWREIKQ